MKGRILVTVQFVCLGLLVFMPGSAHTVTRDAIGRVLFATSALVLVAAFIEMRRGLTVFPEPKDGAPFVTRGIYRYVRHPMYLGVLLFGASEVIAQWSLMHALVFVVLAFDLRVKMRYEDGLLAARWPGAAAYQRRVGALLPRVTRK